MFLFCYSNAFFRSICTVGIITVLHQITDQISITAAKIEYGSVFIVSEKGQYRGEEVFKGMSRLIVRESTYNCRY